MSSQAFCIGDIVKAKGWDGNWVIAEMTQEEDGIATEKPFWLRSEERNDAEGYPTCFGTLPIQERDRYVWIRAAAADLSQVN